MTDRVFQPGERIVHGEYGQGVVLELVHDGYLRAFFSVGERRVPPGSGSVHAVNASCEPSPVIQHVIIRHGWLMKRMYCR